MHKFRLLFLLGILLSAKVFPQEKPDSTTLRDLIRLAHTQSPRSKIVESQRKVKSFEFLTYKSDFRPQISLYGTAPAYTKSFTPVTQPDGSIQFLPVQQNLMNLGISLSQGIPFTGGQLSLNTELDYFYDLKSRYKQFNGTPIFLKLNQPLFGFNMLKWEKIIEPLKYEESKREYMQELEAISQQVTKFFFDVLDAQSDRSIAVTNLRQTEQNYLIEQERIGLGTTSEDRVLQLELQTLKSKQELERANYEYKIASLALRTYIGAGNREFSTLSVPGEIPSFKISLDHAIFFAKKYRPEFIAFERKRMEAERDVAQARAEKQQVMLSASYGLNKASTEMHNVYVAPYDQQTASLRMSVPIIDWGRRSARFKTAKEMETVVISNIELDEAGIVQELTILVENIELLRSNIQTAKKTDSVASRRYLIANRLFQAGRFTVSDLSLSQSEKDNARRSYIAALRDFWMSYYLLRRLTMYDFETEKPLTEPPGVSESFPTEKLK